MINKKKYWIVSLIGIFIEIVVVLILYIITDYYVDMDSKKYFIIVGLTTFIYTIIDDLLLSKLYIDNTDIK